MIFEGHNAIEVVRRINGDMDPNRARKENPNSIRAKYGDWFGENNEGLFNVVHASATPEDFDRESILYFKDI